MTGELTKCAVLLGAFAFMIFCFMDANRSAEYSFHDLPRHELSASDAFLSVFGYDAKRIKEAMRIAHNKPHHSMWEMAKE